jgi:hypothetical protein
METRHQHISRAVAAMWKTLDKVTKEKFQEDARIEKQKHQLE